MSDDLSIPNPAAYRVPRHGPQGLDAGTRRLLYIAGGLGAVVVTVVAAMVLTGRGGGEVPVVQGDSRPIRTKPENPGGMQIAGSGTDVFGGGDASSTAKLAPAAETPDPKGLHTVPTHGAEQPNAAALQAMKPEIVPNLPPGAKPAPQAAAKPAAQMQAQPAGQSQTQALSQAQPKPTPAPAAGTSEPRAPAASKGLVVQLAALSSEAGAKTEWGNLRKRMPELLNSRQPVYTKTERDGRVFWRVRTAGFSDLNDAKGFCERVRAKGAACTVAEL